MFPHHRNLDAHFVHLVRLILWTAVAGPPHRTVRLVICCCTGRYCAGYTCLPHGPTHTTRLPGTFPLPTYLPHTPRLLWLACTCYTPIAYPYHLPFHTFHYSITHGLPATPPAVRRSRLPLGLRCCWFLLLPVVAVPVGSLVGTTHCVYWSIWLLVYPLHYTRTLHRSYYSCPGRLHAPSTCRTLLPLTLRFYLPLRAPHHVHHTLQHRPYAAYTAANSTCLHTHRSTPHVAYPHHPLLPPHCALHLVVHALHAFTLFPLFAPHTAVCHTGGLDGAVCSGSVGRMGCGIQVLGYCCGSRTLCYPARTLPTFHHRFGCVLVATHVAYIPGSGLRSGLVCVYRALTRLRLYTVGCCATRAILHTAVPHTRTFNLYARLPFGLFATPPTACRLLVAYTRLYTHLLRSR